MIYTYTGRLLISDLLLEAPYKSRLGSRVLSPNHRRLIAAKWKPRLEWIKMYVYPDHKLSSWSVSRLAGL